ncbi:GlsB/YeaQ/YmgE family stress response membrane protein [Fodinibius sp. AD559]|uniref:GlsB/YeaQ/YmgE family stress response membrane protein n=1 Tax=Fodinibius sp. AD559 TaxID=3424179 RepID=UPI004046EE55
MSFILLLVIAAICGAIGQSIAGYSMGGCLITTVVGFIGAFIGKWLAAEMGLTYIFPVDVGGETFPIIWSILGSALFAVTIGLLSRGKDQLKK